ncbi:MAG: NAD-dependent epimerase/dehydratase family protein [Anaerolineales bacterium]
MKVLVTGGAGFIGSHTVDLLLERGYQVRVVDALLPPIHTDRLPPDYLPTDDVEFLLGDVRERAVWEDALRDVDFVIHCAAYQDYLPYYSTFFHTNTVSTALLYEVIEQQRLTIGKIIVASSQAVYGEGKYRCDRCGGPPFILGPRSPHQLRQGDWEVRCPQCGAAMVPQWTDEMSVNPHNPYAVSKSTQELVALTLGTQCGIPSTCLRYSAVNGARQSFRNAYSGVLRIFTQRLLHGRPPICYEDGRQVRDYVSVRDVARANLLALEDERANFQIFNVGGNRRMTVWDYALLIAERSEVDIAPTTPGLYRVGDSRHVFSDVRKLGRLGWKPEVLMEEIVDEYLGWAQQQPNFTDYSDEADARMTLHKVVRPVSRVQAPRLLSATG